ncbi:hypothetical protein A9Q81_03190 [Gammaproteobacteria bacterium 42_54_T18]|nr:hypothetical protein A9Q81_03190 [Gammaproteobacteria bacterium 42_54_T18]
MVNAAPVLGEEEEEGLYVIVNVDNTIDSVTINQLSRIFNKKVKKFENGVASLPVAQKSSRSVTRKFNKKILKKTVKQLKYYWARKMFSGSSKPPKSLASDMEVVKFVASLKNAVGYVSQKPNNKNVKVILIEP